MKLVPSPHRLWILLACAAFLLWLGTKPLSDTLRVSLQTTVTRLQNEKESLFTKIHLMESDAITADELSRTLDKKAVEATLAPASRRAMASRLEALASQSRLDSFTYALSPPAPWTDETGTLHDGISQSTLSLEAEAPRDSDVLAFIANLSDLQGRFDLIALTLSRIGGEGEIRRDNIRMRATLKWIANTERKQE